MNFLQMRRILCKLEFILLTKLQFKEYSIKDFFIVLSVILISKSLYYESYGTIEITKKRRRLSKKDIRSIWHSIFIFKSRDEADNYIRNMEKKYANI